MIQSLIIRIVERIATVKDLVKRLTYDFVFRLDCGFLISDTVPSEASYSRMVDVISQSDVLERMHDELIQLAFSEGFLEDEYLGFDATHFYSYKTTQLDFKKNKIGHRGSLSSLKNRLMKLIQIRNHMITLRIDILKMGF